LNAIEWTFQIRFAVALALGFLVGLERESTKLEHQKLVFGGVRTHPIISLYGFGCAWLYQVGSTFMLPIGLLSVSMLAGIAYVAKIKMERYGSTSEFSALLTFVMGALALLADVWVAMALGVINTILLSEKARLETYVENLNKAEFLATLKFLLVTVIILPVLPNQEYTQFGLNPAKIWQVVILVSTVGFVGYLLSKKFGTRVGLWLSGLLGGIVSSTAVTIAAGRLAEKDPGRSFSALQASMLACSVMYLRILVLVSLINPLFVRPLWWKLVVLAIVGVLLSFWGISPRRGEPEKEVPGLQNPFEITPALMFGGLFVVLLVVTEFVRKTIGEAGILGLAGVVGVSDITPFVLSLVQRSGPAADVVTTAILVSTLSNTVVKGVYFGFLASSIRRETAWRFIVWSLLHVPVIFLF